MDEVCSDGSAVSEAVPNKGFEVTLDFISDSLVEVVNFRTDTSTVASSFTADYSINNNGLVTRGVDAWSYPGHKLVRTLARSPYYMSKISVNSSRLILSYPNHDFGSCTLPGYLITTYEKVNNN